MSTDEDAVRPDAARTAAASGLPPPAAGGGDQVARDLQAVNEQLLIAGLRDHDWADQLRRQLVFTRAITRSLGEGVYALDCAGQFTLVNPAAEHILGSREPDLLGKPIDAVVAIHAAPGVPIRWEDACLAQSGAASTGDQHADVLITRRDGTVFPATYAAAPMRVDGQLVGVVVGLRDMTEVQRLRRIQEAYIALIAREHTMLAVQVQERTSELERTNALLQAEIDQRRRTEQARQHLLQQLVTAQEEERQRIARELHDQLGQRVTALMFAVKALHDRVGAAPDLQPHVAALHTLGHQLGQDVRTLAVQLRPPALDDFGLLPTLTAYIADWSAQALVDADFQSTGLDDVRLPPLIEITVFRVVQEALTNILRHAQATTVSVIVQHNAATVRLIVEDNGLGFDVQRERQRPHTERRFGLLGVEERVMQLAGTLTIESAHGSGTTLFVTLPLAGST